MRIKWLLAVLLVSFLAFSSAETVYYNNYNDEIISVYSETYENYDGLIWSIRITDRYESFEDYYHYSNYKRLNYYKNYKALENDNEKYYIYKSKFFSGIQKIRCYNEAPEGKLFYTKCP